MHKCEWVKSNNRLDGYLLAYPSYIDAYDGDFVYIGYSFCDHRYDRFSKEDATCYADDKANCLQEAKNASKILNSIPFKHREQFLRFVEKCVKYYKDKEFPEWVYVMSYCKFDEKRINAFEVYNTDRSRNRGILALHIVLSKERAFLLCNEQN